MDTKGSPKPSDPLTDAAENDAPPPLRWPPPGLGRIYGDLYGAARWLAAGAILILPLLWAVVSDQGPWSLGPLGDVLWLAFLLGIVGVPVLLGGYIVLARLLRRASDAVGRGVHWRVVALVAADHRRDTGFLLQGSHAYRLLTDATRRRLATARLVVGGLILFATLWLSLGFGIAVVVAARGALGPGGVAALTLVPSLVAGAVAVVVYAWEEGILRRSRKKWFSRSWSQRLMREELREWQAAMSSRAAGIPDPEHEPEDGGRARTVLRLSYLGMAVAGVMAFVPVFTLVFSAAIIPVLARISVPTFERGVARYAALEPLRAYALAHDTTISAAEAGATLHTLSFVGRAYTAAEGVLPPERAYETPWFPPDTAMARSEWMRGVVDQMGADLSPDQERYLTRVAEHPAHPEIGRLARAPALDLAGARWSMPLPSGITFTELTMPGLGALREGAYAHLARAALLAHRGETAAADTAIRQVLSVGLLMADEGPTVMDNFIGMGVAELAADALLALHRAAGTTRADALAWGLSATERAVERARETAAREVDVKLRSMPDQVVDDAFPRGVRWEYVGLLSTLGPCINLRRVVFGPDPGYGIWLDRVRTELVRYPSEAELFEVAREGLLAGEKEREPSLPARVLALTMGEADEPGSCARILGEVVGL